MRITSPIKEKLVAYVNKVGGEKMDKNRSSKVIAIIALVVAVFGLTLGFAAFTNTLTITSSATVNPQADTFKVEFSSSATAIEKNAVTAQITGTATAENATVEATKVSGLKANFTAPGQAVTYKFYAHNTGEYEAFLKSIAFANATGAATPKACAVAQNSTAQASLVSAACEDITISITAGEITTDESLTNITTKNTLAKDSNYEVVVTISYAENGDRADGAFDVSFGDITLGYSSANN